MIVVELAKVWRRRTAAVLACAALFPLLIAVALGATGAWRTERVGDVPLIIVPGRSGLSVSLIALSSGMRFFLPLLVAIIAGETVAGDTASGALRYALARPGSRTRLLASKTMVAAGVAAVVLLVFIVASIVAGSAFFGWDPLPVLSGDPTASGVSVAQFSTWAVLGKLAESTAFVAAGMASVFAFAVLLSTLTSRPVIAVAGAVALSVVSRVFNGDYLPGVAVVSHYMPGNDIDLWQHLFLRPADTSGMARFLFLQAGYVTVFSLAAWWRFTREDVLA